MAKKLYVGNLSYDTTEEALHAVFAEVGEVGSVTVVTDRMSGRPKGFAFVEMPDAQQARSAIEGLNLQRIGERAITVNEARPREDRRGGRRGGEGRNRW